MARLPWLDQLTLPQLDKLAQVLSLATQAVRSKPVGTGQPAVCAGQQGPSYILGVLSGRDEQCASK